MRNRRRVRCADQAGNRQQVTKQHSAKSFRRPRWGLGTLLFVDPGLTPLRPGLYSVAAPRLEPGGQNDFALYCQSTLKLELIGPHSGPYGMNHDVR